VLIELSHSTDYPSVCMLSEALKVLPFCQEGGKTDIQWFEQEPLILVDLTHPSPT
jgi:hypothetical protein